ncbi:hypothetical protein TorRG33x02_286930 [Trema orientale]|uniref:DUF936 domain-containing protein n=1 Tax=Trema orientale TaxID=63057 RepID=A0A2P5CFC5_TREOI|nr:hypothetical protein TorRG33x02_286930 [Trema orientale]
MADKATAQFFFRSSRSDPRSLKSTADGNDNDNPWWMKLPPNSSSASDLVHYVSISDQDLVLVYNDEIRLGQFVYVTWLDSATMVPILHG